MRAAIPSGVKLTTFVSGTIAGSEWADGLQEIVDPGEEGRVHTSRT